MLTKLFLSKFSPLRILPILREIKSKEGVLHFRRRKLFSFRDHFLCVHEFYESEKDLYEHDHPRDFVCMTLLGGYTELHNGKEVRVSPFIPRHLKAEYHHRILRLANGRYSLSLSFSFPQKRDWGYVKPDGSWISRADYIEEKRKREGM